MANRIQISTRWFGLATAILLCFSFNAWAMEGDPDEGQKEYLEHCSQCHGEDGNADGSGALFMLPRPRVFKENTSYKIRTTPSGELPTEQDLFNIISKGLPGSSMPGFDVLPEQERWDLVAYIRSLAEDFEDEELIEAAVPFDELVNMTPPPVTPETLEHGKELYQSNKCGQCHGQLGRGNGPSFPDLKDDWQNPILPTNLTVREYYRGGAADSDIYRTITAGLNGTPMPAYADSITPEDRWDLVHYIRSLGPPDKATRDETIVAVLVEALPEGNTDDAWAATPAARFGTLPNIIEPPRLFWNSVEFLTVQAAYTDSELSLRIQWHDRTNSVGKNVSHSYPDRTTDILKGTDHPDQLAVQFPSKLTDPTVRPYFMFGDGKRSVNLWWWQAHTGETQEYNAKGWSNQSLQPERSQNIVSEVTYEDGQYTMTIRRSLTTMDAKNDPQFAAGTFMPIAFHVWNGDRGEVGQRRSLTTWYWLRFQPEIPKDIYVAPAASFAATFVLLLITIAFVRRRNGQDATQEAVETATPPVVPEAHVEVAAGDEEGDKDLTPLTEEALVEPPPAPTRPAGSDEEASGEPIPQAEDEES